MTIVDTVYSTCKIQSPVILDLINTAAFQRLKGISQFGLPDKYYHVQGYSRYDHSIGVFILLNKYGASAEEQVAGLLHDISHTAFSHLADWVFGYRVKEDYQDNRHLSVLQQNEIVGILHKHGFSAEEVANYYNFALLEREIPDLCADRLDYALRELPQSVAQQCFPYLKVQNNEFVFTTEQSALSFAENFLSRQIEHWSGYEAITRYVIFSDMLRNVLQDSTIVDEDLDETDDYVINKIKASGKRKYKDVLKLLEKKNLGFLKKASHPTKKKFRYVDPKVFVNNKTVRLSEMNQSFSDQVKNARESTDKGIYSGVLV